PGVEDGGKRVRLIAGSLYGARSPVRAWSELFYADAILEPGARLEVPAGHEERAMFVVQGSVAAGGETFPAGQLVILRPGQTVVVEAPGDAPVPPVGGATTACPRH